MTITTDDLAQRLEEAGFDVRRNDTHDGPRVFVHDRGGCAPEFAAVVITPGEKVVPGHVRVRQHAPLAIREIVNEVSLAAWQEWRATQGASS